MGKHLASVGVGAVLVAVGLVLYFVFGEVATPMVGLRQLGLVLAALGVLEVGVSGWALVRAR